MNDTQIETFLRRAPQPAPPPGFKQRLIDDIPPLRHRAAPLGPSESPPLWRRWFPAFSLGMLLLGCLLAVAVQTSHLFVLKRENRALLDATADLEQLREENAELQAARSIPANWNQAQKEYQELMILRNEVETLRKRADELTALRTENQRLQNERAAQAVRAADEDPFAQAKESADRIACVNNLKQLGLGARLYANSHNDTLPSDVVSMQHELNTPRILTCPADHARPVARRWEEFDGSSLSYDFLTPGIKDTEDPHIVMFRCRVHRNVGLLEGSVHQLRDESQLTTVDGRLKLNR